MLTVEGLSFSFGSNRILDQASFQLQPAAVTGLLGANGSGKTTLFNIITGFLQPNSGSIRLGQTEIVGSVPFHISRLGVARTFQDLRLIGKLSTRENVLLALSSSAEERLSHALLPACFRREREAATHHEADALLAEFFLSEIADQPASNISYGQQKLLTLACCSAMRANLLLLDEPVAGIASEYRECIGEGLRRLKRAGKTILLIEHQHGFLEREADTFLFLKEGQLHSFDTMAELHAGPVIREAFN